MPTINSSIIIEESKENLFSLIKNMSSFPRFIAGVESIKIEKISENVSISEWRVNVAGTTLTWSEEDIFNVKDFIIDFKMLHGDFGQYSGRWRISDTPKGSKLTMVANIEWDMPNINHAIAAIIDRKTKLAFRWLFREIRRGVMIEKLVSFSPLEKMKLPIISEIATYRNRRGKKIVGYYDHLKSINLDGGFIVIPPGYGETKRDSLTTSYFLVKNGFRVFRFDATNHIGESEGEIINATMYNMKEDLVDTINFLEKEFGQRCFGIVASSLAKRIAIRVAAEDSRIVMIISLVGVVDVQNTLKAVYNEDIIGDLLKGEEKDTYDIFGFEVKKDYPMSAISGNYHDLSTTLEDVKKINIPFVFLIAEKDTWVKLSDVKMVFESMKSPHKEFHVIPSALHQLYENPSGARVAMRQIVVSAKKYMNKKNVSLDDVIEPSLREVAIQNRIEKERLKKINKITPKQEKEFWNKYLVDYVMISKVEAYRDFLELILSSLGGIKNSDNFLDAGCGLGYFGLWLINRLYDSNLTNKTNSFPNLTYTGIDFIEEALEKSKLNITKLNNSFAHKFNLKDSSPLLIFKNMNLDYTLDLPENHYNKICCNLVISYLKNPGFTVRELVKVLKPNGKIVVTSLKPYADLSAIYRDFIGQAEKEEDILEARRLLSSAGQIRKKEGEGHYKFFSEKELKALLVACGCRNIETHRSFGNQANLVEATK